MDADRRTGLFAAGAIELDQFVVLVVGDPQLAGGVEADAADPVDDVDLFPGQRAGRFVGVGVAVPTAHVEVAEAVDGDARPELAEFEGGVDDLRVVGAVGVEAVDEAVFDVGDVDVAAGLVGGDALRVEGRGTVAGVARFAGEFVDQDWGGSAGAGGEDGESAERRDDRGDEAGRTATSHLVSPLSLPLAYAATA